MADSLFPEEELASHLVERTRKYPLKYTDWDLRKLIKRQDRSRNRNKRNKLAAYPGRPTASRAGRKIAPGNFQSKRLCFQYLTGTLVKKGKPDCYCKATPGVFSPNPKDCGCVIEVAIKTYDYWVDISWMPLAGWNHTGRWDRGKATFEDYLDKIIGPYGDLLGPDGSKIYGNDPTDYPWENPPNWDLLWQGSKNWSAAEFLNWYNWVIKHAEGMSKDPFGTVSVGSTEVAGIWTEHSPLILMRRGQDPCENGKQGAGVMYGGEHASEGVGIQYSGKCDCWVFFSMLRFKVDGEGSGEFQASMAEETISEYIWECPKDPETAHCRDAWPELGPGDVGRQPYKKCKIDDSAQDCTFCQYSCIKNLAVAIRNHFLKIKQSNPRGKYGDATGECKLFPPPKVKIQDC